MFGNPFSLEPFETLSLVHTATAVTPSDDREDIPIGFATVKAAIVGHMWIQCSNTPCALQVDGITHLRRDDDLTSFTSVEHELQISATDRPYPMSVHPSPVLRKPVQWSYYTQGGRCNDRTELYNMQKKQSCDIGGVLLDGRGWLQKEAFTYQGFHSPTLSQMNHTCLVEEFSVKWRIHISPPRDGVKHIHAGIRVESDDSSLGLSLLPDTAHVWGSSL